MRSIDHRRLPDAITFFERKGETLPISTAKAGLKNWQPGDVLTWKLPNNANHIGIISNGIGARGLPLVIHNAQRCIEQDYLDEWPVTGLSVSKTGAVIGLATGEFNVLTNIGTL